LRLAGLVKSSLIDYPGKVAAVVFFSGCNYDCFFCHNRALIDSEFETVTRDEVIDFLSARKGLLDGVVVSGGEPTLNVGLPGFLKEIKEMGFLVKLDTNGSNPSMIKQLTREGLLDFVSVDYKLLKGDYRRFCGGAATAETALETISFLLERGVDFEVRTTLIPQIGEAQLVDIAKELPKLPRYVINRYRVPERYRPADEALLLQPEALGWDTDRIRAAICPIQPNLVI